MIRAALLVAALGLPVAAIAQSSITIETIPLPDNDNGLLTQDGEPIIGFSQNEPETIVEETNEAGERAAGAILRALDKVSGATTDIELMAGQNADVFALTVGLTECRYPAGNPAGDAFAYLTIRETSQDGAVFAGWMVASSPALNALDHARYDVWVLRCITS
jgi:hypothetical protein